MGYLIVNNNTKMMDFIDSKAKVIPSVCYQIEVKSIIKFIDKSDIETRSVFIIYYPHQQVEFIVNLSKTIKSQESILEELTSREFFISYKYANALREYIIHSAQRAQTAMQYQYYHETLGYYKEEGKKPIFLLGDTNLTNGLKSLYNDDNIKFRSGSAHDYDAFMNEHILPFKNMRFALVLGLTSVIASYLKDFADVGTILINLSGASSTGKTTTAQFIASLWGQAKVSNLGLVRTFNSTFNALMHGLRGVSGVPVTLDDATTSGFKNRTELIYQLAQSEPKSRMATNIDYRDSGLRWSGAIFITSETPIMSDSESRMGIVSRILDTDGLVFTESAEHAEAIKRLISNTYGHIGRSYVRGINRKTEEELQELFLKCKDEVLNRLVMKDNLTSRIASKLAVIYMTAILAKDILQYQEINPGEVLDYLITKDQEEVEQRHIGEKALEVMKVFFTEHHRQFEKLDAHSVQHIPASGLLFGHFRYHSEKVVITVPTSRVEHVLKSHFIYDTRVIYDYWYQKGIIQKQQDRYSISDTRLKVRTIKFDFKPDEEMMIPWLISPLKSSVLVKPDEVPVSNIYIEDQDEIDAIFAEREENED
jgi:hypothetical protein